ncbi:uncharacterized protein LOC144345980 [Saccoglossus kowalevskii]
MAERIFIAIVFSVLCGFAVSVPTDEDQEPSVVKVVTEPPPEVTEAVPAVQKLCTTNSGCDCQYHDCRREVCEWDNEVDGCVCFLKACTYRKGPQAEVESSKSTPFRATLSAVFITAVATWLFSY